MATTQTIPVLDLQDFQSGDRSPFVTQFGQALEQLGFCAIVNHSIEPDLIQAAYQVSTDFFALSDAVKLRYQIPALHGQRGFTQFGREHAKDHPAPDLKEFWHLGREAAGGLENLMPIEVPQFHPVLMQLYRQLEACALELLRACALYLGEPEFRLAEMAMNGDTILRVIHYPPIPADAHPASLRSAPHEDINLITLLCEATTPGLEILQRDGTWLPIPALPGQIIVDSGDMLQWLTNGILKSTTHRVVNPVNDRDRRFSMPFFVHARPESDLSPLASCVDRVGDCRFSPITAGAYLQQRLREIGLAP
jgi:isopenicillin N synthase-like dioxygenase